MNLDSATPQPSKYVREHTPTLKDVIFTRREFLEKTGMGFGAMSLASILGLGFGNDASAAASAKALANPLAPKQPHFPAKAKAVIHIFAEGGPSHVDTWDPKPALAKYADQTLPGLNGLAFPSPFKFNKMGKSGIEVSEVFPKLGECIDDMAIIRSLWTDIPAHEVAQRFMNTGSLQLPKPSMGSWVVYGLGTENQNMPGFITLSGKPEWRQASFLPGVYQGCRHAVRVTPEKLPLSPRYRIARADVAAVFVAAMRHPRAARTTFEIAWEKGAEPWLDALDRLTPD